MLQVEVARFEGVRFELEGGDFAMTSATPNSKGSGNDRKLGFFEVFFRLVEIRHFFEFFFRANMTNFHRFPKFRPFFTYSQGKMTKIDENSSFCRGNERFISKRHK